MKRTLALRIALCLSLLAAMPCAGAATKPAGDPWATVINLELKDTRLPDALGALFKGTGISYDVEADTAGITVRHLSIKKEPLRAALSSLMKAAGTVQTTRGTGKDQVVAVGPGPVWSKKVSLDTQDMPLQDVLRELFKQAGVPDWPVDSGLPNYGTRLPAKDLSFIKVVAALAKGMSARFGWGFIEAGDPWQRIISNMEMKDTPFSEVVDALLKEAGVSYTIDPAVNGLKVTAVLKNVTMEDALRQICKAAGTGYRVEKGVYAIGARPTDGGAPSGPDQQKPGYSAEPGIEPATTKAPDPDKPNADQRDIHVTLDLKDTDVRNAIESLFKGRQMNYSISRDVDGTIPSLTITDVPFSQALNSLLKSIGAVSRTDNGVVMIEMPAPWSKPVSVGFRDTPLREALEVAAKEAGTESVPVASDVPNPKVTYSTTGESYITVIRELAKLSGTKFSGRTIIAGDPLQKPIDIEFKDTPLPEAIDALFKDTGISYTIDPNVQPMKVTAVLKNVSLDQALKGLVKAAGVVYRVEGGVYMISARPSNAENAAPGLGAPGRYGPPGYTSDTRSAVVAVQHLTAGELAPIIANRGRLQVTSTSNNKLVITGSEDDMQAALKLIEALDVAPKMVDAVEVTLILSITIDRPGRKPDVYESSVRAVGPEGSTIPLDLGRMTTFANTAQTVTNGKATKQTATNSQLSKLNAMLTPSLTEKGELAVTGSGTVSWVLQAGKPDQVMTAFNVAASGQNRQILRASIASGEVSLADGRAVYQIQLIARTQPGKVPAATQAQPLYSGGGGYGGSNYGGRAGYGGGSGGGGGGGRSW